MLQRLVLGSCLLLMAASTSATQSNAARARVYRVTITNLTRAQVFSPPVIATHREGVGFFKLGEPASDELATMAENGMGGPLATKLAALPEVFEAVATSSAIGPGASESFEIRGRPLRDRISVAGMLVNTNDAFFAIDGRSLPIRRSRVRTYTAVAYDAGSEFNNESCAFIPGNACDPGSMDRDTDNAEGYVYVSNGVHGLTLDLPSERYDWHNPVAVITIQRIR